MIRPLNSAKLEQVLMTADTVGGVWTYALELSRALDAYGVTVTLATMGRLLDEQQREQARSLRNVQVFESDFALEWMADPWEDVDRAADWLLHLEALVQPDIVHLNGFAHASLPWTAPVLVVGHSCVCSWYEAVHGTPPPPEWSEYRQRVSQGLRAADAVTAPTAAMLSSLMRHYGGFRERPPIPNGRGPGLLRPGRKAKEPLILSAGRLWDEAKNLDAVCRVAPGLPWQVCAAGSADHPDGRKAPLPSIHWLGVLSAAELAAWYARAAIFALPARYEPFGLAALEAALSGCALVLGDISSLREIWGDAALYVPPNDADALWNALHQLIKSPTALAEHQRKSTAKARFYTPQRMAEAYLKAYGELLSPPQAEASVVARANSGSS